MDGRRRIRQKHLTRKRWRSDRNIWQAVFRDCFLGVGFGVDTYIYKAGKSTTTITDADGTQLILGHRLYLGTMVCQRSRFIGNSLRFLILFPEFLDIGSDQGYGRSHNGSMVEALHFV